MILVMQAMLFSFNSSLFLCLSRSPFCVLLRDHYIVILLSSWDSSICIAILFSVKQKGKKKKATSSAKAEATVTPGISQQNGSGSKAVVHLLFPAQ